MASRSAWMRLARPLTTTTRATTLVTARIAAPVRATGRVAPVCVRTAHHIPRPRPRATTTETTETTETSQASPPSTAGQRGTQAEAAATGLAPHYELTFTCVPCGTRSAHRVTKQGYHHGSVLITCPSCRNRHIISDHLGIFGGGKDGKDGKQQGRTVEDILRAQGRLVKKGTLGEDGDIEFWEDGTSSDRVARLAAEDVMLPRTDGGEADGGADDAAPGSTFGTARKP